MVVVDVKVVVVVWVVVVGPHPAQTVWQSAVPGLLGYAQPQRGPQLLISVAQYPGMPLGVNHCHLHLSQGGGGVVVVVVVGLQFQQGPKVGGVEGGNVVGVTHGIITGPQPSPAPDGGWQ